LRLDVISVLAREAFGARLRLRAENWPKGRRLIGRIVELAILGQREAAKELLDLKSLVERESQKAN
jgi:hypothetical protein